MAERAWRGKGVGSRRIIEGSRPGAKYSPSPGPGPAEAARLWAPGEVAGSSRAFESLWRGKCQESRQKEDLFSSETLVRFKRNRFVKDQNDSLLRSYQLAVELKIGMPASRQAPQFCFGFPLQLSPLSLLIVTFLPWRLEQRVSDPFKSPNSVSRSTQSHLLHAAKTNTS